MAPNARIRRGPPQHFAQGEAPTATPTQKKFTTHIHRQHNLEGRKVGKKETTAKLGRKGKLQLLLLPIFNFYISLYLSLGRVRCVDRGSSEEHLATRFLGSLFRLCWVAAPVFTLGFPFGGFSGFPESHHHNRFGDLVGFWGRSVVEAARILSLGL